MSAQEKERDKPPDTSKPAKHIRVGPLEADSATVEVDPQDRFHRYDEEIAKGKFKTVYRGYDTENGIDVAWCKVRDPDPSAAAQTLEPIYAEMKKGLALEHSGIIRCFACWMDSDRHCINLITELFTSGTLRSYREMYTNVDLNVHRKYVKQILNGLAYLHAQTPPVIHADIRLDKIYVNGFNGEVKIGDLGLTTLLTRRYHPSEPPEFDSPLEDLFSLGLCVYELLTGTQLDRIELGSSVSDIPLHKIKNPDARNFIARCLEMNKDTTATSLLKHNFLKSQSSFKVKDGGEWELKRTDSQSFNAISTKLRGEDWNFDLQGYESGSDEASLHIRLIMSNEDEREHVTLVDFDYNLETDTPDSVGGDIADKFQLSSTDRELCKAALKEWLAVMAASKAKRDAPPDKSGQLE